MGLPLRSLLVESGFAALSQGLRVPSSKNLADLDQWGQLIDLVRKLEINVFLDVGANEGRFSKHLRAAGYKGRLISFEPIPQECAKIKQLAQGDPEWKVCCLALGNETTESEFHIYGTRWTKTVFSSLLRVKDDLDYQSETISAPVRRLDDLIPSLIDGISRPRIFLKMDTQGSDRNVFDGAINSMQSIVGLQSELSVIHLYEGVPHFTKNIEHYESFGFELMNLFVVSRTGDGRVVEYDCVMAKTGGSASQPLRNEVSLKECAVGG